MNDEQEYFLLPKQNIPEFAAKSIRWSIKILYEKVNEMGVDIDIKPNIVDTYEDEQVFNIYDLTEFNQFINCFFPKNDDGEFIISYSGYEEFVIKLTNEIVTKVLNHLCEEGSFEMVYDPQQEKIIYRSKEKS
jgi:hypothetical protein